MTHPEIRSSLVQKFGATAINAGIAAITAAPILWVDTRRYREGMIAAFFLSAVLFRDRCMGCRIVGSFHNRPTTLSYCILYTLGFASCFYWIIFPGDLLLVNVAMQAAFLWFTGNTAHGWLTGTYTRRHL